MNEQVEATLQDQLLKILFAEGLGDGLANIAQLLMNAAMLIERENHIGAGPYRFNNKSDNKSVLLLDYS
jgi:hypothetical protein